MADCILSVDTVNEAFLSSTPLISLQILDLSMKHPAWLRDVPSMEPFPLGKGTQGQQLIFRSNLPKVERGFQQWKRMANNAGCGNECSPDCGYNWTMFGGHGLDRKIFEMESRDFRSPDYCIKEIQTTADYQEIFTMTVQTLHRQVEFFKEVNIVQNALTLLSKKFVVDSGGPKANPQDIYSYRPKGAARLSMLNINMLRFFYEWMAKLPDCVPYDVINGAPIFALECSNMLLSELYRVDANLRQDVRFSGLANDLVSKYNFLTSIQGMFIPAPILYPRRFGIDANGAWEEILPFLNDIPAEVGAFSSLNPAYEMALYEEVLLHGQHPFKVFYMPTATTLGENTSFGPEFSYFNAWKWINPLTKNDPFQRVGYFATNASIGIAPQFSEGIFGIIVERPNVKSTAMFYEETACPPEAVVCNNEVPAVSCPCPLIISVVPNPVTAGNYFIQLGAPLSAELRGGETIQLGLRFGGYVTATIVTVTVDGYTMEVTMSVAPGACTMFTSIYCDSTLGCYSDVLKACECGTAGNVSLFLKNPIKADTVADHITAYFCDGTSADLTVVSVDMTQNIWVVSDTGTSLCTHGGVISVCVPPGTDPTCPACGTYVVTQCES